MALDPQNIPISFQYGVDLKTDEKQVMPGKMLSLTNASFRSPKQFKKRDGFTSVASSIFGGGSISTGVGIASLGDELVTLDGQKLYSYSEKLQSNVERGTMVPVDVTSNSVFSSSFSQTNPDMAYSSTAGLYCYAWNDAGNAGGVSFLVLDSVTRTRILSGNLAQTGKSPKVVCVGSYFLMIFYDSNLGEIGYQYINTANPSSISAWQTINSDASASAFYSATVTNSGNLCFIAYRKSTNHIAVYTISSSLVLSTQSDNSIGATVIAISMKCDASDNVWIFYGTIASGTLGYLFLTSALSVVFGPSFIVAAATTNITAIINGTTATIYYTDDGSVLSNFLAATVLKTITADISGTVGSSTVVIRGCGLASQAFTYGGVDYIPVLYAGNASDSSGKNYSLEFNSQQPTYFIINSSGQMIAKISPLIAGSYYTSFFPSLIQLSSTSFTFPYLFQDVVSSQSGNIISNTGIAQETINFSISHAVSKLNIAGSLLLASGQLWEYDGQNIVEQGFSLFPENLVSTQTTSHGGLGVSINGSTSVNQVQYIALYEWTDAQGKLNRSATSPVLTVTLPLAASTTALTFTGNITTNSNKVTSISSTSYLYVGQIVTGAGIPASTSIIAIDGANSIIYLSNPATATTSSLTISTKDVIYNSIIIPTLKFTNKENVSITLWRTQNNATIFYKVPNSVTQPPVGDATDVIEWSVPNNPSVDYITFVDTSPDSAIIGNDQLYTTGGEVDNIAPPALSAIVSFKNRAVGISPENKFQWFYSKQAIAGSPVEFSAELFVENVDQKIGSITAIGTMDDKLVFFGPTSKFFIVGDGPTPAGTNNDFTEAIKIIGTTGCSNQTSILELPIGLVYQDPLKGIWLLDRSLQEQYIGADVSQYNSLKVTSAQLFENANRALFTLEDGTNLIYDYYVNQWETDVYPAEAIDSTIFEQDVTYIQANGSIFKQTPGVYTDNGSLIPLGFKTGWFNFAQINGFQRLWEFQLLGTYKSPHTLTLNFYYDFETTVSETVTIPVLSDPGDYQFRVHLKRQKCTSIQVELIESQTGTIGEGMSLSGMSFRVALKQGTNKLSAEKSF
jgi:hypothetical protein